MGNYSEYLGGVEDEKDRVVVSGFVGGGDVAVAGGGLGCGAGYGAE